MANEVNQKIFKTLICGDGFYSCDAIEYKGGFWLVPHWLEAPSEGYKIPTRIIRFDKHPYQKDSFGADFLLNAPIPKAVLDGQTKDGYEVIDRPDLKFYIPEGIH